MKETNKKVWEIFPGNNRILCGGRLITSKSPLQFIIAILMKLTCCSLFFGFNSYYFWEYYPILFFISTPLIAWLLLMTLILMFTVSFMDPGIQPRPTINEIEFWHKRYSSEIVRSPVRTKSFVIPNLLKIKGPDDNIYELKYCKACQCFRQFRVVHCRTCNNCVMEYDHHCEWLSNCIGKRNYRLFYLYLLSLTCLITNIIAFSIIHYVLYVVYDPNSYYVNVARAYPATILNFIIGPIIFFMVLALLIYHTKISFYNLTSNEEIKIPPAQRKKLPFDTNFKCAHFLNRMFGQTIPSSILLTTNIDTVLSGNAFDSNNQNDDEDESEKSVLINNENDIGMDENFTELVLQK